MNSCSAAPHTGVGSDPHTAALGSASHIVEGYTPGALVVRIASDCTPYVGGIVQAGQVEKGSLSGRMVCTPAGQV